MPSLTLHSDEVVNGTKADLRRSNSTMPRPHYLPRTTGESFFVLRYSPIGKKKNLFVLVDAR